MEKQKRTPTSASSRRQRAGDDSAAEHDSQDDYNSLDEGELRSEEAPPLTRGEEHAMHSIGASSLFDTSGSQKRLSEMEQEERAQREARGRPSDFQFTEFPSADDPAYRVPGPMARFAQRLRTVSDRHEDPAGYHDAPHQTAEPVESHDEHDRQLTAAEMRDLIRHLRMTIDTQQSQPPAGSDTEEHEARPRASDSETNYESAVEHTASRGARRRPKKKIHFQLSKKEDRRQGGGDASSTHFKSKTTRPAEPADASSDEEPEPEPEPMSAPHHNRPRKGSAVPFRTFDGKRWAAFKRQFDSACIANKIPDEDRGARLECALVGEATDVLGEEAQTYEQLVETLNARYGETKAKKEVLLELMQMKRESTETVLVFADRMKRVARSGGLKPDENVESLYMAFVNGLSNFSDTLTAVCKKCKTKSLNEAAQVASKYEMLHGRTPSGKTDTVKTSWGIVAAAPSTTAPADGSRSTSVSTGTKPDSAVLERIAKLEREAEKISALTKTFREDVQATRKETKVVSDSLLQLKTKYEENEAQRAASLARRFAGGGRGGYNGGRRDNNHNTGDNQYKSRAAPADGQGQKQGA